MNFRLHLLLLPLALVACTPSLIPGTSVADTGDNREVLKLVELYRQAVERKDVQAILDLVSPAYYDTRGHPDDPSFHWDYEKLRVEISERFATVKEVKLDIVPRHIDVKRNKALVSYLFTQNFIAHLPSGEIAKHDSDLNRMELERVGKRWLITRGL